MSASSTLGECLSVPERLIVAPSTGTFRRLNGHRLLGGDSVHRGDVIGTVQSLGTSTPIECPFDGNIVEILASDGERLRPGQPVAWLRVSGPLAY